MTGGGGGGRDPGWDETWDGPEDSPDLADDALLELWSRAAIRLRAAMTDELRAAGRPSPSIAATSLAVRGRLGLTQERFSEASGVTLDRLQQLEGGGPSPDPDAR